MVVEDEKDILDILCTVLNGEGYEVVSARNGEEALKRLPDLDPHLILLDMNMPKMGGVSFYHRIYDAEKESSRYPVLFLTGRSEMEKLFRDLHVDGFLSKPFQIDELLREVRRILEKRFGQESQAGSKAAPAVTGPPKVLIVDGDPESFERITLSFLTAGYTVNAVSTAAKALEKATSPEPPDLVLIRLNLPDMPGDMLAYRLKLAVTGNLPMLLYSAALNAFDRQLTQEICQRAGILDPLETLDPETLLKESAALLNSRRAAA